MWLAPASRGPLSHAVLHNFVHLAWAALAEDCLRQVGLFAVDRLSQIVMILAQVQIKVHVDVYREEVVIVVGSCLVVLPAAILVSLNVLIVCDFIEFLLSIGMRIGSFRAIVLSCPLLRSTSLYSCSRRCSSVYQVLHRDWSW